MRKEEGERDLDTFTRRNIIPCSDKEGIVRKDGSGWASSQGILPLASCKYRELSFGRLVPSPMGNPDRKVATRRKGTLGNLSLG